MDKTIKEIDDMVNQISSTIDCQSLELLVSQYMASIEKIISDKIKDQISIAKNAFPLLNLPSPDPVSIVKWLGKLIAGDAALQLQSYITQAIEIIQLSKDIVKLAAAIGNVEETLKACLITIQAETLSSLEAAVTAQIQPILDKVNETQNLINTLTNISLDGLLLDTSSPEAFLTSVDTKLEVLQSAISSITPEDIAVPPAP
ncbi:MAG: hypothetical protein WCI60_05055 [bacterium]